MAEQQNPFINIPALGEIDDPSRVHLVVYLGNSTMPIATTPLAPIIQPFIDQIAALEARVDALENP